MDLMKITEVTEKVWYILKDTEILWAGRFAAMRASIFEKYRFYDSENISRLKQIIVLRKMQIPIKDILRIYESQDMEILVQSFVRRIEEIALSGFGKRWGRVYCLDFWKKAWYERSC